MYCHCHWHWDETGFKNRDGRYESKPTIHKGTSGHICHDKWPHWIDKRQLADTGHAVSYMSHTIMEMVGQLRRALLIRQNVQCSTFINRYIGHHSVPKQLGWHDIAIVSNTGPHTQFIDIFAIIWACPQNLVMSIYMGFNLKLRPTCNTHTHTWRHCLLMKQFPL